MAGIQIMDRIWVLVTAILLAVSTPAHAERVVQEGVPGILQKSAAPEFLVRTLIADLGSFELAFVTVNPTGPFGPTLTLVYLPAGDELNSWNRKVTVHVNSVGPTPVETRAALMAFIPFVRENFVAAGGGTLSFSEVTEEENGPALYLEAVMGQGNQPEDTMAIWRQVDRLMITVLNQKRGGKLTEQDRQATKRVRSQAMSIVVGAKPAQ